MKIVADYWQKTGVNPKTGEEQWIRCSYTDQLISGEQARELNAIYNLPSAPGSMRMSDA